MALAFKKEMKSTVSAIELEEKRMWVMRLASNKENELLKQFAIKNNILCMDPPVVSIVDGGEKGSGSQTVCLLSVVDHYVNTLFTPKRKAPGQSAFAHAKAEKLRVQTLKEFEENLTLLPNKVDSGKGFFWANYPPAAERQDPDFGTSLVPPNYFRSFPKTYESGEFKQQKRWVGIQQCEYRKKQLRNAA
jgi:hypothetical protein